MKAHDAQLIKNTEIVKFTKIYKLQKNVNFTKIRIMELIHNTKKKIEFLENLYFLKFSPKYQKIESISTFGVFCKGNCTF